MNAGTGGGKSRNLIHKPENQCFEFHPLGRLPPLILPSTRYDHRPAFKLKSPIADWNSDTGSLVNKVTARKHHQRREFNSRFFVSETGTPSGANQNCPPQQAKRRDGRTLCLTATFIAELLGCAVIFTTFQIYASTCKTILPRVRPLWES